MIIVIIIRNAYSPFSDSLSPPPRKNHTRYQFSHVYLANEQTLIKSISWEKKGQDLNVPEKRQGVGKANQDHLALKIWEAKKKQQHRAAANETSHTQSPRLLITRPLACVCYREACLLACLLVFYCHRMFFTCVIRDGYDIVHWSHAQGFKPTSKFRATGSTNNQFCKKEHPRRSQAAWPTRLIYITSKSQTDEKCRPK